MIYKESGLSSRYIVDAGSYQSNGVELHIDPRLIQTVHATREEILFRFSHDIQTTDQLIAAFGAPVGTTLTIEAGKPNVTVAELQTALRSGTLLRLKISRSPYLTLRISTASQ